MVGSTLLPSGGHIYFTAQRNAVREAVNAWMRSVAPFDALADFDLALRNPMAEQWLRVDFDSGGKLHPDAAGYEAMARAVPLDAFQREGRESMRGRALSRASFDAARCRPAATPPFAPQRQISSSPLGQLQTVLFAPVLQGGSGYFLVKTFPGVTRTALF